MRRIPIYEPYLNESDKIELNNAFDSGWISSLGESINKFENSFAEYCGVKYALTTSNGTASIHLALKSYGIGPEDEVIIPDLTFIATANAVAYTGATVIPVDIQLDSLCIDPEKIESVITKRTKAIIPVHLYGHPADMEKINEIAKEYGLKIIEDAAEAHGAEVNGKKVGSWGDCGTFSFYGNKIITTGEGGMITTNCEDFYLKARHLKDHAMSKEKRYWHTEIGFNYRMTNIQAALGVSQLSRIEEIITRKIEIFNLYKKELEPVQGISLNRTKPWIKNVFWMFCMEVEKWDEQTRDEFIEKLKDRGIDSRPYFYPISDLPMYRNTTFARTPVTHNIYFKGINLPSSPTLKPGQIKYICDTIKELLNENRN